MIIYEHALICSAIAMVYAVVIPSKSSPIGWWYDLLNWATFKHKYAPWITNPLGMCAECFTGQLALWSYIYIYGWSLKAVAAAALSILFTHTLTHLWNQTQ